MSIVKHREEDATSATLKLKGEVDLHSSNALRSEVLGFVKKRLPRIALDMSEVSYIDSSGLATLIEGAKACAGYGGALVLQRVQKRVMDVFKLAHLHSFFQFES